MCTLVIARACGIISFIPTALAFILHTHLIVWMSECVRSPAFFTGLALTSRGDEYLTSSVLSLYRLSQVGFVSSEPTFTPRVVLRSRP